jgi:regulator of RNase E activity RraA
MLVDTSVAQFPPLPSGVIDQLKTISSGTLTTQLFKRGLRQCFLVGLKPINPGVARFAGEAFTMRLIPAREDIDTYATITPYPNPKNLQWEAAEQIQRGQVLVIDSRNDVRAGTGGSILLARMLAKGVAGVVTDGALRDGIEIAALGIPAFARQVTASSRLSYHHTADLQVPISCSDVAVYPGDILVGDADGVTVIPRYLAAEVAEDGAQQDQFEAYLALRIAAGEPLYGVYPPDERTKADFVAWTKAGTRAETAPHIRAEAVDAS